MSLQKILAFSRTPEGIALLKKAGLIATGVGLGGVGSKAVGIVGDELSGKNSAQRAFLHKLDDMAKDPSQILDATAKLSQIYGNFKNSHKGKK